MVHKNGLKNMDIHTYCLWTNKSLTFSITSLLLVLK